MRIFVISALIVLLYGCSDKTTNAKHIKELVISNLHPRLDTEGRIVDLHDGRVIQFGETFYWYGTSYGSTTGFTRANTYQCYKSKDMSTWEKVGPMLQNAPSGIYYRPHVIFNEKTSKYVLWYNWYPTLWDGKFGVAISDTPEGPFRIINEDVEVAHSSLGVGDHNLFVDVDGAAYLSYNTISGHRLSVEKLSEDYLSSTMDNGGYITEGCEAGSIFKRDSLYYLLTDYTCCFCTQGSGARVYTSKSPLAGYQLINNINRHQDSSIVLDRLTPNQYILISKNMDGTFDPLSVKSNADAASISVIQFTGNRKGICGDTTAIATHDLIEDVVVRMVVGVDTLNVDNIRRTAFYNEYFFNQEIDISQSISFLFSEGYPYDNILINGVVSKSESELISHNIIDKKYQIILNKPIIPAQQTHVMTLMTKEGMKYIWMGDLWGSASDNVKGHDYQYWSSPLEFDESGHIKAMEWVDEWTVELE